MNINDVKDQKSTEDMLVAIFKRQKELHEKYVDIEKAKGILVSKGPVEIDSCHGQQILKDFKWRITEELGEAANCLKNKPWKQTEMHTDQVHYVEEIIDALHFFVEMLILIGLEPEDVYNIYMKKSEVNKFRQRSNY